MPLNDFFTYKLQLINQEKILATIQINPDHKIFNGHFPDNQVVPGVAQLEILRQILSSALQKKIMLVAAKDIKYMNPMLPEPMSDIMLEAEYRIDSNIITTNCVLMKGEIVFTKIRGTFREE